MADWEAEDYEPPEPKPAVPTDKWEGEDEDDVKDNWDDDTEAPKPDADGAKAAVAVPKKKRPLAERIAEKKEQKQRDLEQKRLMAEEANKSMSPAEEAAERLRVQRLQEESDFMLAKEAFGESDEGVTTKSGIEYQKPESREDFNKFATDVEHLITKFEKSLHYVSFLEQLFRSLAAGLSAEDAKKLGLVLSAMASEKAKAEKQTKGKSKKKAGAKLAVQRDDDYGDLEAAAGDDFDDFI